MEIQEEYNFIKRAGELTDDGVALYDLKDRRFVYVNDNFLKIFGITRENLTSNDNLILQIILAEDLDYLRSRFNELLEKGHINTTEFRLKFSGNTIKHLSCDVLILDNSQLVTAFVKDISKAKLHEDYLIKYTIQKDTLLDMLTHNLSGPLFLSKDIIETITQDRNSGNPDDIHRMISLIAGNTQQCIDIVSDFLRKEHNESALVHVKTTRFDVLEKINITLIKLKEMNRDITFKLVSSLDSLNINSDPVKFFQIIHNLLSNAIKFTPDNGLIEIEVTEDERFYLICIRDNGIGIPDPVKPTIFNQKIAGRTGLRGEKSLGLGLSIVKKLVTLMDGKIWFESEEGSGSAFFVQLPKETTSLNPTV
jgi:two-component system sensor histidine kinase VicK